MMISVLKNTQSRVHFWLLRNCGSAQFQEDLATMAAKYKFEYDFVEYHWPNWVMRQTERQKVIWGNKILFLDALFPMNLSRVIYLDADAVARGDLIRLMKADLKGNPYGFVPFCSSRREMAKYHFWTKGYWKRRLTEMGKKKYHISAMFVVDLDRYRRMGAGDKLRRHYAKIAGGSQSLANLDQDLPNDAQDSVPIFSLPKRWLWCCTWCSDLEKDEALIIDLANNPKTKISKVEMAKQFIEEWPLLEQEALNFRDPTFFVQYNLTEIRAAHRLLAGVEEPAPTEKPRRKKASPSATPSPSEGSDVPVDENL
jgi:UDP-glucose:glycoprotein glucosyltransferase